MYINKNISIRTVLLFGVWLLQVAVLSSLKAQNLSVLGYSQYSQYTNNEGLSSSEIHCIHQDREGFIWVGTDQGLCRFDSEDWSVFTSIDGLPDNMVVDIKEDATGKLWLKGLNDVVFSFDPSTHEVFVPAFNKTLSELFYKSRLHEWHMDETGSGYLSVFEFRTHVAWKKGFQGIRHDHFLKIENFDIQEHIAVGAYEYAFFNWQRDGHSLWAFNRAHLPQDSAFFSVKDESNGVESFATNLSLPGFHLDKPLEGAPLFFQPDNNTLLFAVNNRLYHFDLLQKRLVFERHYPNVIVELFQNNKGDLYVGQLFRGGFFIHPDSDISKAGTHHLPELTVTSFYEDRDKALWIGSVEAGLLRFTSSVFQPISPNAEDLSVTQLLGLKGRTFVVYKETLGCEILQDGNSLVFDPLLDEQKLLRTVWCRGDTCVANYSNRYGTIFTRNQVAPPTRVDGFGKASIPLQRNRLLSYSSMLGYSIYNLKNITREYHSAAEGLMYRVNSTTKLSPNKVLLGTDHGLKLVHGKLAEPLFPEILAGVFIYDVLKDTSGYLWVATKGSGLYRIHLTTGKYSVLSTKEGLPINSIYDLEMARGVVFGATNRGLFAVKNKEQGPGNEHVEVWNMEDGLPSLQLHQLAATEDHLILNCAERLVAVELQTLVNPKLSIPIYLRGLKVNDIELTPEQIAELPHSENNLNVQYQCFHFGQKRFPFWYKTQKESPWNRTFNTELNLIDLAPGYYNLMVSPIPQFVPGKTLELNFEITPPFTQTWLFLILVVLASIGLLSFVFWVILSRERLSRRLLFSQQQALTSQMNPHFIFNALNSIHNYIGSGSTSLAQTYLSNFSILMRQVLDSSRSGEISLQHEIDSLRRYIELEQARFKESYALELEIDPQIAPYLQDLRIPSMIVQPYVENAILHGLRPLEANGQLELHFALHKTSWLRIWIADNGVGRKKAQSDKPKRHTSHGMSITGQRIELLNKKSRDKITVTVSDRIPQGTQVEILVPIEPLE